MVMRAKVRKRSQLPPEDKKESPQIADFHRIS